MVLKHLIIFSLLLFVGAADTSAKVLRSSSQEQTRSLGLANDDPPSDIVVHRINCGASSDFTDSTGELWSMDQFSENGWNMGWWHELFNIGDSPLLNTYHKAPR